MIEREPPLDSAIRTAADFHGHLGPFLVLGVRIGLIGLRELGISEMNENLQAIVIVKKKPPFSCTIDGIQVTTHCTVGNGKLRVRNSPGEVSAIFKIKKGDRVKVELKSSQFRKLVKSLPKDRGSYKNIELARKVASARERDLFVIRKEWHRMQTDIDLAKQKLREGRLSLVVVKKGKVLFETKASGVTGLLASIEKLGKRMMDASVGDKIVGRAAALLLAYSRIKAVFAMTVSNSGIEVLKDHGILYEFENLVPRILDSKKTDVCPFEKLAADFSKPKDAYEELKTRCAQKARGVKLLIEGD